ncbi:MAG: (2Fe-2S)-binding protein [Myxococcota bacterium]
MIRLTVNGETREVDVDPDTPLLWVLREELQMTGTRFGCGKALCGACTVHLGGNPVRSCSTPVVAAQELEVRTIESLGGEHPVQAAWVAENVPQCGYCQSGQIMSAVALLETNTTPSDEEIAAAMDGNICRCGTYPRIQKAIKRAAAELELRKAAEAPAPEEEAETTRLEAPSTEGAMAATSEETNR